MTEPMAIVIAAIIATSASLLTLFTQLLSFILQGRWINKQFVLNENLEKKRELRERLQQQLSEFYDPIYTLLSVNKDIFDRIGPRSIKKDDNPYILEEKKIVWDELVDYIIIKNNEKICEIIENKLHLLSKDDNIASYLAFTTHARAYQIYRRKPYEDYLNNFSFPQGFLEHVRDYRNNIYQILLNQLETNS